MNERIPPTRTPAFEERLKKRYASERRFKLAGIAAIMFSIAVLAFLLVTMTLNGIGGFQRAELTVPIDFKEAGIAGDPAVLSQPGGMQNLEAQDLPSVVERSEEHTSELQSRENLVCRLLLEKKNNNT